MIAWNLFGDNRSLRFSVCMTSVVHTFLMEEKAMPDYEELFLKLMKEIGKVEKDISRIRDEMCGMYFDERMKEEMYKKEKGES